MTSDRPTGEEDEMQDERGRNGASVLAIGAIATVVAAAGALAAMATASLWTRVFDEFGVFLVVARAVAPV